MVDRIRVLSREGYLDEMREAILNDPQRRVDVTGGNSYYQIPLEADLAAERTRGNARLYQWCTVTQPDPAFASRSEGLEPVDPARPLGKWNAKPTWAARTAPTAAVAAAAQRADVPLIALQQLQQAHGNDLSSLPKDAVREQLLARRVPETELQGPSGAWRQLSTLRKLLLERGDRIQDDVEDEEATAADEGATAAGGDVPGGGAQMIGGVDGGVVAAAARPTADPERRAGGWVCCSSCAKWRLVVDPLTLPDDWECSMNTQSEYSACTVQQEVPEPDEEVPFEDEGNDDFLPGEDVEDSAEDDSDVGLSEGEDEGVELAPLPMVAPAAAPSAAPEAAGSDEATGMEDDEDSPCPVCNGYGKSGQHWISCDVCGCWVHASCAGRQTARARAQSFECAQCLPP